MRRLLAVLALPVALLLVLGATTARAQDTNGYSGGWTDPQPDATNDSGWPVVHLDAPHTLSGQVSNTRATIDRLSAVIVEDPDHPTPDGCAASLTSVSADTPGGTVTFHVDGSFPCNFEYVVKATASTAATALRSSAQYQMPLAVSVAFPPAPVGTVTATAASDGNDRTVTLEWPANSEPDLLGYVVQRTVDDETVDLGQVKADDTLEFVDRSPTPGTSNQYDVIAVRDVQGPDAKVTQVAGAPTSVSVKVPSRDGSSDGSDGDSASGGGSESQLTTVVTGLPSTGKPDSRLLSSVRARGSRGAPSGPPTTFDSGFDGTLPFDTRRDHSAAALPGGDPAVVATYDEGGSDSLFDSKGAMTFIAGGLAILVGAAVLFYVSRRAAVDAY
jgi:hypothetical protein